MAKTFSDYKTVFDIWTQAEQYGKRLDCTMLPTDINCWLMEATKKRFLDVKFVFVRDDGEVVPGHIYDYCTDAAVKLAKQFDVQLVPAYKLRDTKGVTGAT
jgi:uncharacterized protein with NAD-binding domain and iron-sulfur cluster